MEYNGYSLFTSNFTLSVTTKQSIIIIKLVIKFIGYELNKETLSLTLILWRSIWVLLQLSFHYYFRTINFKLHVSTKNCFLKYPCFLIPTRTMKVVYILIAFISLVCNINFWDCVNWQLVLKGFFTATNLNGKSINKTKEKQHQLWRELSKWTRIA